MPSQLLPKTTTANLSPFCMRRMTFRKIVINILASLAG